MTTRQDIANELGMSFHTVAAAFRSKPGKDVSDATKAKVLAAAERLGYEPKPGRRIGSGKKHVISKYPHPLAKAYNQLRRSSYRISWGQHSNVDTWQHLRDEVPPEYWEFMHQAYVRGALHGLEASLERE